MTLECILADGRVHLQKILSDTAARFVIVVVVFYLIHFPYLLLFDLVLQGLGTTHFTSLMAEIESNVNQGGKTADFTNSVIG